MVMAFDSYIAALWGIALRDLPKTSLIPTLCTLFLLRSFSVLKLRVLSQMLAIDGMIFSPPFLPLPSWNWNSTVELLTSTVAGVKVCLVWLALLLLYSDLSSHPYSRATFAEQTWLCVWIGSPSSPPALLFLSFLFCPILLIPTHLIINNVLFYLKTDFSLGLFRNWDKVWQCIATLFW